jgi:hypothetical protein
MVNISVLAVGEGWVEKIWGGDCGDGIGGVVDTEAVAGDVFVDPCEGGVGEYAGETDT